MTASLVTQLKAHARKHLLAYRQETEGMDCGHTLAQATKPSAAIHAREFDTAMDALGGD